MQTLHRAEASSNLAVENPRPEVSDFAQDLGPGVLDFREGWVSEIAWWGCYLPWGLLAFDGDYYTTVEIPIQI